MRGIVAVVTGGGKTVFAFACMLEFFQRHPEGAVWILVPSHALLDQWAVSLQEDLHVYPTDMACHPGPAPARPGVPVQLAVINTARTMKLAEASRGPVMLVVDECHRAGSAMNSRAMQGTFAATLGLSATPEREFDAGTEELIMPALGPILCRYDYVEAARDGVIAPFALTNVRVALTTEEVAEYQQLTRSIAVHLRRLGGRPADDPVLKRLLLRRARVSNSAASRVPVACKLVELRPGARTLVFHERISAADDLVRLMGGRGHRAAGYHTRLGMPLRQANLRDYRRGDYDVLVSCRALDEGVNVPETQVAIIAASTASTRQRIQRLGRALRPAAGKDMAHIYSLYATRAEERRLQSEAERLAGVATITWMSTTTEAMP